MTNFVQPMHRIFNEVCIQRNIDPEALMTRRRKKPLVKARHEIFWHWRKANFTWAQMGRFFGCHHSTAFHGAQQHQIYLERLGKSAAR